MRKIYRILGFIAIGVIFMACDGNAKNENTNIVAGINNTNETAVIDDSALEKIAIDVKCTTPATISDYIELLKDDTIVKSEDNTTVSIYHNENSNKKVCLDYGEAYIERII